jgi:hypothetical protein
MPREQFIVTNTVSYNLAQNLAQIISPTQWDRYSKASNIESTREVFINIGLDLMLYEAG